MGRRNKPDVSLAPTRRRNATGVIAVIGSVLGSVTLLPLSPVSAHVGPNNAPIAWGYQDSTAEQASRSYDTASLGSDPDGDALVISAVGDPANGTATLLAGGGRIRYVADQYFVGGSDSFTYTLTDTHGLSSVGTITVAVSPAENSLRSLAPATRTVVDGQTITLLGAGHDLRGGPVTVSWSPATALSGAATASPILTGSLGNSPTAYRMSVCNAVGLCAQSSPLTVTVIPASTQVDAGTSFSVNPGTTFQMPVTLTPISGAVGPFSLNIAWPHTDETIVVDTLTPSVTHAFAAGASPGRFDAVVCASSANAVDMGCDAVEIEINDSAPTVALTVLSQGSENGDNAASVVVAASDPDGDPVDRSMWIDSSGLDVGASCSAVWAPDFSNADVRCNDDGVVTVTVAAVSRGATVALASAAVTVTETVPTISFAPVPVVVNSAYRPSFVINDSANDTASCVSINWGDGTAADPACGPTHVYTKPGTYTMTVAVVDDEGRRTVGTTAVTATYAPGVLPSAPTLTGATVAGVGSLRVAFTRPASPGTSPITLYQSICTNVATGKAAPAATGTSSPISVTGLSVMSSYRCVVRALNSFGAGAASARSVAVLLPALPGTPRSAVAATTTVGRQLRVRIAAPVANGGSAIVRYRATCSSLTAGAPDVSSVGNVPARTTPTSLDVLVNGLKAGATYRCLGQAGNVAGFGPATALGANVRVANVPGAPTVPAIFATGTRGTVLARVVPPSSNGGAVVLSYAVTCSSATVGAATRTAVRVVNGSTASRFDISVSGLTRGVWYRCTAKATNQSGAGAASAVSPAFRG